MLLIQRRVELLAVSAKRLMRAPAEHTLEDGLVAGAVVMTFFGAFPTNLGLAALEGFMADLLTVVALVWARSAFEGPGVSRFSSSIEEALRQQPPRV